MHINYLFALLLQYCSLKWEHFIVGAAQAAGRFTEELVPVLKYTTGVKPHAHFHVHTKGGNQKEVLLAEDESPLDEDVSLEEMVRLPVTSPNSVVTSATTSVRLFCKKELFSC